MTDLEDEESGSTRYVVLLEDSKAGRVAKLAFPSQELFYRYCEKKALKPSEVHSSYVELSGEAGESMHAFYCQWGEEGAWEISGYSLDGSRPVFAMKPVDVRSTPIPIVTPELLSEDSFAGRSAGAVSKVSSQLARPIQALDFDLLREIREIPRAYKLCALLLVLSIISFFALRVEQPRYFEEVQRAPWLNNNLNNISYFEGDGRIVFEGEMEPRAVTRLYKGLDVIQPGEEFVISRYTLYRDAGLQEELDRGEYWTPEGFATWQRTHYANIKFGYAKALPNGSSLAYDFVTNKLYGNLRNAEELSQFTSRTPTDP